jgi:predicted enzyme related to lactoylglutathione lyase
MTDTQAQPSAASLAPGTPIWVDLSSTDLDATRQFYGGLLGWQAEDLGPEAGGYVMFRKDGKVVAAVGPKMDPQQPTVWSTYFKSSDAEETARKVREAGGSVIMEPFDVMEEGRMGIFQDTEGAFFSVWQPKRMQGAELFNAPGALSWNELLTRNPHAATAFYPNVFNWTYRENKGQDDTIAYIEWQAGGRVMAGCMPMSGQVPAEVPPHWQVYFGVDNVDAAASKAQELGGQVVAPPMDIPQGRFAILSDPHGATFGVFQM